MQNVNRLVVFFIILLFSTIVNADNNNFLVFSDIHLVQNKQEKMEISPNAGKKINDLDEETFLKMLTKLKSLSNPPKFILILGDIVGHRRNLSTSVEAVEASVFNAFKTNFPNTPIFYIFGNNDSLQADYGLFKDPAQSENLQSPYDIAMQKANWGNGFLSTGKFCKLKNEYPCLIEEDINNGYFAAYIQPGFKLLGLNTVVFSTKRPSIAKIAAENELIWLEKQLQNAKENAESVLLAAHIPPGNNIYDHSVFWKDDDNKTFLKLVNKYQANIIAMVTGHTHADEIKIIKNIVPLSAIYFVPGLSTSHGNQPAVKQFYFAKDSINWILTNYETLNFFEDQTGELNLSSLYYYDKIYCNKPSNNMFNCINNVTIDKIQEFYTAGNKNFLGIIGSPEDINLQIP